MCGRLFQVTPPKRLSELFGTANPVSNAPPRYNAAPSDLLLTVRYNPKTGERALDPLRWGLVPHWAKDAKIGASLTNARAETIAEKPSFRDAFDRRRCLVPVDGFYEWHRPGEGAKQPYAFAHPANGAGERPPLALAGLWESWRDPDGGILRTITLVTTAANSVMAPIHDRMPVILTPETWAVWLGESAGDAAALMRPCPDALLDHWPVSPAVGNVRNQGAELPLPQGAVLPLRVSASQR
jgi:putative SOS response-associated peptidase YedK